MFDLALFLNMFTLECSACSPCNGHTLRMPEDDDVEAIIWMAQQLMKDLQEAKMWPIKMSNVRYQDDLRHLADFFENTYLKYMYTSVALIPPMQV